MTLSLPLRWLVCIVAVIVMLQYCELGTFKARLEASMDSPGSIGCCGCNVLVLELGVFW
jgi:hypothetical protein